MTEEPDRFNQALDRLLEVTALNERNGIMKRYETLLEPTLSIGNLHAQSLFRQAVESGE